MEHTLDGKPIKTELKSWEDQGTTGFIGPAIYRKQFTAPAAPRGKRVHLEIADSKFLISHHAVKHRSAKCVPALGH